MTDDAASRRPRPLPAQPPPDSDLTTACPRPTEPDALIPTEPAPTEPAPTEPAPAAPLTVRSESRSPSAGEASDRLLDNAPTVISQRPPLHTGLLHSPLPARELGQTLVGRRLAHFHLTEFVGGGGMGAVFRASDTMLNRTVAVKVLSRDQGQDEETVKRFQNEAQSAARLDHENIARVYFVGEEDGWYFIVFEFIEGRNLRELVNEQGPMAVEQALQVTLQVADALDHSAKREVVHRDIKPSNVLLTPQGRAKLVDMGLARLKPMRAGEDDLTASGVTLGTFDYISPEQARDPRTADVRSDIYSLGCTLYFMLTGQPPFPGGTVLQKLLSHSGEAAPDPRQHRDDLPPELIPVMNKMLAKKPSERYQQPIDLIADLLLLAERLGIATAVRTNTIWVTPATKWWHRLQMHLPWFVPVATLLLLALFFDPAWLDGSVDQSITPRPLQAVRPPVEETDPPTWPLTVASEADSAVTPSPGAAAAAAEEDRTDADPESLATVSGEPAREGDQTPRINPDSSPGGSPQLAEERTTANGADAASVVAETRDPRNARPNPVMAARRVIVDDSPSLLPSDGELVVGNLTEACRVALQNLGIDTIEVRQNGRIELGPLLLRLEGRSLRLVAGTGYAPILSFRTGLSVTDYDREGMIRVQGGRLTIQGLHLEMTVPDDTLDGEWSLFELEDNEATSIRQSTITIHNSYGGRYSNLDNVAVFHLVPPDRNQMLDPDMGQPRATTKIELADCVVRCEATLLRSKETAPLNLTWTNGLLVTSETLARLGGRGDIPRAGEQVSLNLQQVTAVVDQGLAELTSSAARPNLLPVHIVSQDCIWVTQRWSPLITQTGPHSLADWMNQLHYQGNHNAYEGMDSLWKINSQDGSPPESFDFERWQAHWNETGPIWQQVRWRYAVDKNRPIHEHRIADYALGQIEANGTKTADTPATLGFIQTSLPRLPEPERLRRARRGPTFSPRPRFPVDSPNRSRTETYEIGQRPRGRTLLDIGRGPQSTIG